MDNAIAYEIKACLHSGTGDLELECDSMTSLTLMLDAPITYDKLSSYVMACRELQVNLGSVSETTLVNNLCSTILPALEVDLCDFSCKESSLYIAMMCARGQSSCCAGWALMCSDACRTHPVTLGHMDSTAHFPGALLPC